jgi:hypothetical protein
LYGSQLGNPGIYVPLLFLESEHGGGDNFVRQFLCGHICFPR